MNTEQILSKVMKQTMPPDGFADRVMARIESEQANVSVVRKQSWLSWRRGLAAAALVTIVLGAGFHGLNERRIEREGLRARQEVLLALQIASEKTAVARDAVVQPQTDESR